MSASLSTPLPSMKHTGPPAKGDRNFDTDAVVSLLRGVRQHLEQSEIQLMGEVTVRGQVLQTLTDQQDLMDTLTAVSETFQ